MFDLDELTVEFKCPGCGFSNEAATKQFRNGATIICRGCKADIRLADHEGSVTRAKKEIDQSFEELRKAFGKTFEIKL